MKILIVGNLYPPHYIGGYELRCSQVAEHLHQAGYEIRVLTSSYGREGAGADSRKNMTDTVAGIPVERSLCHHAMTRRPSGRFYTLAMAKRNLRDARRFIEILEEFRPDIVNWWNLEGLTKTLLPIPAQRGIPDVHCVEDNWMVREYGARGEKESFSWFDFWRGDWGPRILRPAVRKALQSFAERVSGAGIPTRPFENRPRHVCFVSEFLRFQHREAGLVFPSSEVIYGGVAAERFHVQRKPSDFETGRLRLLYGGYVDANRGLHTIVEALGLIPKAQRDRIELSVAQSGPLQPDRYMEGIQRNIERLGLTQTVTFLGKLRHDEMPRVYAQHHLLVFSSTRPEGLPMTMMEAMCAGCAVITTGSGGSIEIADRADLPVFPQNHPLALSRLLAALESDRRRVAEIARRGQKVVLEEFTFDRMMKDFHRMFQELYADKPAGQPSLSAAREGEALRKSASAAI